MSYAYAAARTRSDAAPRSGAVGRWRCWHSRRRWRTQGWHVILRKMHLWRHDDGSFYRQLRRGVTKDDLRRRNLLHCKFGKFSLRCGQRIMISSSPATCNHIGGGAQRIGVRRGSDESYDLSLLGLLHHLSSNGSSRKKQTQQCKVNNPRSDQAIRPVVVVLAPDFSRRERRLCSQV